MSPYNYVIVGSREYSNPLILTVEKIQHAEQMLCDSRMYKGITIKSLSDDRELVMKDAFTDTTIAYEDVLRHFKEELPEWLTEAQSKRLDRLDAKIRNKRNYGNEVKQ